MRWLVAFSICLTAHLAGGGALYAQGGDLDQVTPLIQKGQFGPAEALLKQVLARGESAEALYLLGFVQIQTFRYAEAEASLRRAVALQPRRADWLLALAKSLLEQGKNQAASDVLDRALELDRDPGLMFAKAMCALNLGRSEEAERNLRQALPLQPDNPEIHFKLAEIQLNRGDYPTAAAGFETTLRLNPDALEARFMLGLCRRRTGDLEQARDAFLKVLERTPGHVGALYNLAQTHTLLGEEAQARQALERFREATRLRDEVEFLRRGVRKNPDNRAGRMALATKLLDAGYTQEALEHLIVAQKMNPGDAQTYELLSTTFSRLGRTRESEQATRIARELRRRGRGPGQ